MDRTELSITTAAVPAKHDGTTRKLRDSIFGAHLTAKHAVENGRAISTFDSLRVSPLLEADPLWEWVQPLLSSAGHIIGAPKRETTEETALAIGIRVLQDIYLGKSFVAYKPEYAIPVLTVLARASSEEPFSDLEPLRQKLSSVVGYAKAPAIDDTKGMQPQERFINSMKYAIAADVLRKVDLNVINRNPAEAPHWRTIKTMLGDGVQMSNKTAKYIRRLMTNEYAKKRQKWHTEGIRRECLTPISGEDPVLSFIESCWRMRGSSISSSLPKKPPEVVATFLEKSRKRHSTTEDPATLRCKIVDKFRNFQNWVLIRHGPHSSPNEWSDTLSKFAANINPQVEKYNKMVGSTDLLHATSFVPGDLAPEMYKRGECCTGYFFLGGGWLYKYSAAWRRDAFCAFIQSRLPSRVDSLAHVDKELLSRLVPTKMAFSGGRELLHQLSMAGITELEFTTFLRQYYWSGAFLCANLEGGEDWVVIPRRMIDCQEV